MAEHDELVEKVARALARKARVSEIEACGFIGTHLNEYVDAHWQDHADRARAAIAAMGDGFDAREYLIRNALQPAFPGISPSPTLAGVCTQVDHILAGQQSAIAQSYVLLWSIVTDDVRQHRARRILLDAMGGQGSTRQKLAMEKYGADHSATHIDYNALGDGWPSLSPELIDKLNKLATYLTEQGEYEACDLIDTVVARLTPPPGEKP